MSKATLLELLARMRHRIEEDDSFEGSLQYEARNFQEFEVSCCFRIGNSDGQGAVCLVEPEKEETA